MEQDSDEEEGEGAKKSVGIRSQDHREFSDMLLMNALSAKKLCHSEEEFKIYSEYIFHNLEKINEEGKGNKGKS
jgi:hypothetical protein